jgi:hypothetical protein
MLHRLLDEAQSNGVMTEISRPDLNVLSARTLQDKLERLEVCPARPGRPHARRRRAWRLLGGAC